MSDPVPSLRPDLLISAKPDATGLYDVCREGSEKTFTLYDFEVSIARMLDGRRPVSKLIDAAGRIGIPVTLESLRKFLRQLHAYGFLDDGAGAGSGPWAARDAWKPEVRELYQSALRTFRKDRLDEARKYLDAIEEIEPELPEVADLRARIEEREASGEAPQGPSFAELHGDPDLIDDTQPKRRRGAWIAAGVGLCAIAGVSVIPLPSHVTSAARLSPVHPPTIVVVPRAGKIQKLLVAKGAWVQKGQPLAKLATDELDAKKASLTSELAAIDHRIARFEEAAHRRPAERARAKLEKKEKSLASLSKKQQRYAKRPKALAKLQKRIAKAQAEVDKARAELDKATKTAQLAQAKADRATRAEQLASVNAQLAQSEVDAPAAGAFEPSRREGDPVVDAIGTVSDTHALQATLSIAERDLARIKPGMRVTFASQGSQAPTVTKIASVQPQPTGGVALAYAPVPNPDGKLSADASGVAEIDCGKAPLIARLFR